MHARLEAVVSVLLQILSGSYRFFEGDCQVAFSLQTSFAEFLVALQGCLGGAFAAYLVLAGPIFVTVHQPFILMGCFDLAVVFLYRSFSFSKA